jgi:hypothetical protein
MAQVYRTLRVAPSDEGVLGVVIDAPPMNLIGPELVRDLVMLIGALESGENVRVMVLESADPEYFVPHVDLTKVAEYTAEAAKAGGPAGRPASHHGHDRDPARPRGHLIGRLAGHCCRPGRPACRHRAVFGHRSVRCHRPILAGRRQRRRWRDRAAAGSQGAGSAVDDGRDRRITRAGVFGRVASAALGPVAPPAFSRAAPGLWSGRAQAFGQCSQPGLGLGSATNRHRLSHAVLR